MVRSTAIRQPIQLCDRGIVKKVSVCEVIMYVLYMNVCNEIALSLPPSFGKREGDLYRPRQLVLII